MERRRAASSLARRRDGGRVHAGLRLYWNGGAGLASRHRTLNDRNIALAIWRCSVDFRRERAKAMPHDRTPHPDLPPQSWTMPRARSRSWRARLDAGHHIPLHMHRRGQLLHAVDRHHAGRDRSTRPGSCRRRARSGCRRNCRTASPCAAMSRCARSISTPPACEALPQQPVLVEISGLLRELILALLEEPAAYDENGRGGIVARLILTELARLQERRLEVPMPRDPRALRVARALLDNSSIDYDLDRWAERGRRQPAHAGAHVPQRDRLGLCRMARPPARHRRPGAAVGWRLGRRDRQFGRLCQPERLLRHDPPHLGQPAAPAHSHSPL